MASEQDREAAAADRAAAAQDRHEAAIDREMATEQVRQLQAALRSSREIGMAIGIVAEGSGVSTDAAFKMLSERSQRSNTKLWDIAKEIVALHN